VSAEKIIAQVGITKVTFYRHFPTKDDLIVAYLERTTALGTVTIGGDLTVGNTGYGAMQLTGPKVWGEYPDRDQGIALLRQVVDEGVTFIDTADVYGPTPMRN
jgi:AcrR family transcriptional regulator